MGTTKKTQPSGLVVGQPFNPFGLFNGIFLPEALVRLKSLSAGAKLSYGRLSRYAGQDGKCFPSVSTLASEIGVGERQAQRYLTELENQGLIQRVGRFERERGQKSNAFKFLWHRVLENAAAEVAWEGVTETSPEI